MIQLYYKGATADVVGAHGLSEADFNQVGQKVAHAHQAVCDQIAAGKLGYADLPNRKTYRDRVGQLVAKYKAKTTDLVVLGIGGSALGNIALQTALKPVTYNLIDDAQRGGPRLFVLDNVDPCLVSDTLDLLGSRLGSTVFNVISKSGETAETASQFMIVREMLRAKLGKDFARHIVATTDEKKGTLHDIAKADGYDTMPVPEDVGGRFSVLSPVGLFSAAMCGIDTDKLLAGAAAMLKQLEPHDWRKNPGTMLAAITWLMFNKGKPIQVMMPYSNRLYGLADWYRQLWAESLGKAKDRAGKDAFVGPTPIKALGTTDQHSQAQLYREGPNDKLVIFLEAATHPRELTVPDVFGDVAGLSYLRGTKLSALLQAEKVATEYALAVSQRPTVTIRFDAIDEESVGAFIMYYEFVTSVAGELFNINAYDQPAVELGKQATFALIGRKGYEKMAADIQPFAKPDEKYVLR